MSHCSHIKLRTIIILTSWQDNAHNVLGPRDPEFNTYYYYHCLYYNIWSREREEVILPVFKASKFSGAQILSTFTHMPFSSIWQGPWGILFCIPSPTPFCIQMQFRQHGLLGPEKSQFLGEQVGKGKDCPLIWPWWGLGTGFLLMYNLSVVFLWKISWQSHVLFRPWDPETRAVREASQNTMGMGYLLSPTSVSLWVFIASPLGTQGLSSALEIYNRSMTII